MLTRLDSCFLVVFALEWQHFHSFGRHGLTFFDSSLLFFLTSRFDIRLMKEGRMKGQAFIGLPNEKAAAKALKEANGYVLFGKPMVVVSF